MTLWDDGGQNCMARRLHGVLSAKAYSGNLKHDVIKKMPSKNCPKPTQRHTAEIHGFVDVGYRESGLLIPTNSLVASYL